MHKLLRKQEYDFSINKHFFTTLEQFAHYHTNNWLQGRYAKLLQELYLHNSDRKDFQVISVELLCKKTGQLIAGEIGYIIGATYTSLSGFSSKEKAYQNWGTLQLVLLAQYLEKNKFAFWNFGHPHMPYKHTLGCKVYPREDFLRKWMQVTQSHSI